MIWDEDPFDPINFFKLGVNLDPWYDGSQWDAMRLKLAVVNKRRELIQSEEIRNDHFLLERRRARQRAYDKIRRTIKGGKPKQSKECLQCKKQYVAYRVDQKYCSSTCKSIFTKERKVGSSD